MADLTITGFQPVELFLGHLKEHLILKKDLANLILHIIRAPKDTPEDFLHVTTLVDSTANYTDSKKRKASVTSESVRAFFSTRRDLAQYI